MFNHLNWHFKLDALFHNGQRPPHGSDCGLPAGVDVDEIVALNPEGVLTAQGAVTQPDGTSRAAVLLLVPLDIEPDNGGGDNGPNPATPAATTSQAIGMAGGQQGITGDLVESYLLKHPHPPLLPQKHYVSPRSTVPGDYVVLKSGVSAGVAALFEWVLLPNDPRRVLLGAVNDASVDLGVRRDVADQVVVQLRFKPTGQIMDTLNVWIVWATFDDNFTVNEANPEWHETDGATPTSPPAGETLAYMSDGYNFQANVEPETIFDISADIPDLTGQPVSKVPHADTPHVSTKGKFGQPLYKWDITRAVRVRFLTPRLGTNELLNLKVASDPNDHEDRSTKTLFDGLPSANRIAATCPEPDPTTSYPTDPLEGNDNSSEFRKGIEPYRTEVPFYATLRDEDEPKQPFLKEKNGFNDSTFEERVQFKEFCRLEIGGKWYVISDPKLWRLHVKLKDNGDGHMRDNHSVSDFTNNGWE